MILIRRGIGRGHVNVLDCYLASFDESSSLIRFTPLFGQVGYDDALDAFGVHGVGGLCGGLLTGFFANDFVSGSPEKRGVFYGKGDQVWIQVLSFAW
jgi:ammonia channel protein AmtB